MAMNFLNSGLRLLTSVLSGMEKSDQLHELFQMQTAINGHPGVKIHSDLQNL